MFDKIKLLVSSLDSLNLTCLNNGLYKECKQARKILQDIKRESYVLRKTLIENVKKRDAKTDEEKAELKKQESAAKNEKLDGMYNDK